MHAVPHPAPLATASAAPARVRPLHRALLAGSATVLLWVAAAACLNDSQLQDSLEQFVWGRGLEWGYWKHPPLTSWVMWAALQVWPSTPLVTYGLAALFGIATLVCTTLLAERLFGEDVAVAAALLLALHYGFTRRAQLYNHNTVLVACVALAALLVLLAVQRNGTRHWIAAGAAAGLAMLAKYQAALPLAGLLLAVAAGGDWRRCRAGVALAFAVALLVVAPHALWVVEQDFTTFRYAAQYVEASGLGARGERSASFLAMQAKFFLPMVCFLLLLWATSRRVAVPREGLDRRRRAWLLGLAVVPLALVLLSAWAGGVRVQGHWGLQATQFVVLPIALVLVGRFGGWSPRQALCWGAVQVVALALFVGQGTGWVGFTSHKAAARALPAADLSRQVQAWWRGRTGCDLAYLSGDVSMAGMLAAYAGRPVRVLEDNDPAKSPWIDLADMQAHGWIEVREGHAAPGATDLLVLPLALQRTDTGYAPDATLLLQAHPPTVGCAPGL